MMRRMLRTAAALVLSALFIMGSFDGLLPKEMSFSKEVLADSDWVTDPGFKVTDKSFMEAQDLDFSTKNSFKMKTMMADPVTGKEIREVEIPVTFELKEEKPSDEKGFKDVTGVFTFDNSVTEGKYACLGWVSAFDSYSGISFESAGRGIFGISMDCDWSATAYPTMTCTVVVTCPESYDQTVFYCGYEDIEMNRMWKKLDMDNFSYTIDELPYFPRDGKHYYFFSGAGEKKEAEKPTETTEVARPQKAEVESFEATDRGYLVVTVKKISRDCNGYDLQISTSKDFSDKQNKSTNLNEATFVQVEPGTTYYARVRGHNVNKGTIYPGKWSDVVEVESTPAGKIKKPHKKENLNRDGKYDEELFKKAEEWIDVWHEQLEAYQSNPVDQATVDACNKQFGQIYKDIDGKYPKLEAEGVGNSHSDDGTLYWGIKQYSKDVLDPIFYEYY